MQTLRVGVALPDPPFNGMADGGGLDIDLIEAVGAAMEMAVDVVAYDGSNFNGIFDELATGAYDCVIAGTTVTSERERAASFGTPYLISGQALAVDATRLPAVKSIDDLAELTIGVQHGNTSQPIAERLVAQGKAKAVRVYAYGDVRAALADLSTGGCDAFMKLAPVLAELARPLPGVDVVQRGISREGIAIAVKLHDEQLLGRIEAAQGELEANGTLQEIRSRWLGNPYRDQSLAAH